MITQMTFKSRWAHDFNKKLQELYHFEFDLPAVFIDTFHRRQSEHEVSFAHSVICQLIEDREMSQHKLRLCHDAYNRYYTLLAKNMQYLCFYQVLTQVEMFRKNTLKLWEFAERKLDNPFRCRDIQVSYSNTTLTDTNDFFPIVEV